MQRGCFPSYLVSADLGFHLQIILIPHFTRVRSGLILTICLSSYHLSSSPRPVVVEPLEQFDDEDGLPEKLAQKNPRYQA